MRKTEQIKEVLTEQKIWFEVYGSAWDGLKIAFVIGDRRYCCIASWNMGWDHVSVHMEMLKGAATYEQIPLWDDMCIVRGIFFKPHEWAMQLHPPESKNISAHNEVLHLWRPQKKSIPKPPRNFV